MNLSPMIITLLMLTFLTSCDPLQTTVNILNLKNMPSISRVTKLQQLTYTYLLANINPTWSEYPGLNIVFHLNTPQYVFISYSALSQSNNVCYVMTKLLINKVENRLFRIASAYTNYHSNTKNELIWMESGRHEVNVQYRTDCSYSPISFSDWNTAYLKLQYFDN